MKFRSILSKFESGKIRKILVKDGDQVEMGTPLVLVEAMKMEFSIKAPSKGTVKKILVACPLATLNLFLIFGY